MSAQQAVCRGSHRRRLGTRLDPVTVTGLTNAERGERITIARAGTQVALRILDLLERSAGIRVDWIGPLRFGQTKAFFRKHADQSYSFTN